MRAPIDLIVATPASERFADERLVARAEAPFSDAGHEVVLNGAYKLHLVTLAARSAARLKGNTCASKSSLTCSCLRDGLVSDFTPFQEMDAEPMRVERIVGLLARAL